MVTQDQTAHELVRHGSGVSQHQKDAWRNACGFARSCVDPRAEKYGIDVEIRVLG